MGTVNDKEYITQIKELKKNHPHKIEEICNILEISSKQYIRLNKLDQQMEICRLEQKHIPKQNICQQLDIQKEKYDKLVEEMPENIELYFVDISSRNNNLYTRIDNYNTYELYRGILIEAFLRLGDNKALLEVETTSKFGYVQQPLTWEQSLKTICKAIVYDLENIINRRRYLVKDQDFEVLDIHEWCIEMVKKLFKNEEDLIKKVFKNVVLKKPFNIQVFNVPSCCSDIPEKNFVQILFDKIDEQYSYGYNGEEREKNSNLVKYYFLKYLQAPILKYNLEYSNPMLSEHNFSKVLLTIDLTIPQKYQIDIITKELDKLYQSNMPYTYSRFIDQKLFLGESYDTFEKIHTNNSNEKFSQSELVSNMFYLYDMRSKGFTSQECADKLYIEERSAAYFYIKISNFMEEFEQKFQYATI